MYLKPYICKSTKAIARPKQINRILFRSVGKMEKISKNCFLSERNNTQVYMPIKTMEITKLIPKEKFGFE